MPRLSHLSLFIVTVALGVAKLPAAPDAPPTEYEPGQFITVGNPITSAVVGQIKETIARAEARRGIKKVVFDFNPDGKDAASADIGPCFDLARYIRGLHNEGKVLTIGFVRAKTTRHTVLPALACGKLVMAPDAALGAVTENAKLTPDKSDVAIYTDFARPEQAALILKMLDASIEVLEGQKNKAVFYVVASKEVEAAREHVTITSRTPVLRAGTLGLYRAAEARKFELCEAIAATRQQVEIAYSLPPGSYREDPLAERQRVPWRLVARGAITPGLESSLKRQLDRATKRGANLIFLQVECFGGSVEAARDLADYIRGLRGPDGLPVMTVAFIPHPAPDTATFLALGCNEIVMAKPARLGDWSGALQQGRAGDRGQPNKKADKPDLTSTREMLEKLAEAQGYSPILIRGLFDDDLEIVRARKKKGAIQETRFLTPNELDEKDANGEPVWKRKNTVKHPGKLLVLTGETAPSLGFARHVVEKAEDVNELYRHYAVEPSQVHEAGPDWLDSFAFFLADPFVSGFLVLVGISCLILELKMPGASLPGIVAAVCFVLFFWSQSQMNGQITLLAVLLFLLGIVLLGIEIFVIPGFGVIGFSGLALILFGLALATVERMPQTSQEWGNLGQSVLIYGLSFVGAMVVAFSTARFLPYIPVANRLMLQPPDGDADRDPMRSIQAAEQLALLGAIGTAATMLRPAGLAQFGEKFIDVVTDGGFVPAAAKVQVIEIEGNRVVVKEV